MKDTPNVFQVQSLPFKPWVKFDVLFYVLSLIHFDVLSYLVFCHALLPIIVSKFGVAWLGMAHSNSVYYRCNAQLGGHRGIRKMRLHFTHEIENMGTMKTIAKDQHWLFVQLCQVKLTNDNISDFSVTLRSFWRCQISCFFFFGIFNVPPYFFNGVSGWSFTKLRLFKVLGGRWCSWFLSFFAGQTASFRYGRVKPTSNGIWKWV